MDRLLKSNTVDSLEADTIHPSTIAVLSGGITCRWKHIYNHISKAANDTGVKSPFNNGKGDTVKDDRQWAYMVARKDQQQMALLHPVWNFHSRRQRPQARRGTRRQRLFIRSQPEERTHWPRKWFGLVELATRHGIRPRQDAKSSAMSTAINTPLSSCRSRQVNRAFAIVNPRQAHHAMAQ